MESTRSFCSISLLALLAAPGCLGQVGETGLGEPDDPTGPDGCNPTGSFASARLSLLTDDQYVRVVKDVFGVTFEGDVSTARNASGEYGSVESGAVSTPAMVQVYLRAADQVAAKIKPCGVDPVTAGCVESFLRGSLPRAWRRPVTDEEIRGLLDGVFSPALVDGAGRALQLTMEAALASPAFLYRAELGDALAGGSGRVALTPHELAAAVSFALTDSAPDPALWAVAQDGSLADPAVLAAQVDRLLALPTARETLRKKVSYYLNFEKVPVVNKDRTALPAYTPALQAALYQSGQRFVDDLLGQGRFSDLFSSTRIYANADLARVYGLAGVTGAELQPADGRAAGYGAGLLSHPALLASSNQHAATDDIVHRGLWIYENLVCGVSLGAPPPDADEVFATLTGTEREKTFKRNALSCGACHRSFDPFGLVSQDYDPIGRHRLVDPETGGPVQTGATIVGLGPELDGDVAGLDDLAARLAGSRRVSDCAAVMLSRYLLDHNPEVENACRLQRVKDAFAKTGSFTDLWKALLTSPAFRTRDREAR